jgi:hypothetical protein
MKTTPCGITKIVSVTDDMVSIKCDPIQPVITKFFDQLYPAPDRSNPVKLLKTYAALTYDVVVVVLTSVEKIFAEYPDKLPVLAVANDNDQRMLEAVRQTTKEEFVGLFTHCPKPEFGSLTESNSVLN